MACVKEKLHPSPAASCSLSGQKHLSLFQGSWAQSQEAVSLEVLEQARCCRPFLSKAGSRGETIVLRTCLGLHVEALDQVQQHLCVAVSFTFLYLLF